MVAYFKVDLAARDLDEGLHGLCYTRRGKDVEWLFATAEVHAADESRKTKEVVAMQVGDANEFDGLQALVEDAYLSLCVFSTI